MSRETEKIKKMQTIFKAIYPQTWYQVERLVNSQYPTDKIIRIVKESEEDLISRKAAIRAFTFCDGSRIPEVDVDNFPIELPIRDVKETLRELASAQFADDVISRDTVIRMIERYFPNTDDPSEFDDLIGEILAHLRSDVMALPSINE